MSSGQSSLANKKGSRREARIKENYDRISAALAARDSRGTNKTRIIPDVPGFTSLSKTEIKRDTKEIEANTAFAVTSAKDGEEHDAVNVRIKRSVRPPCNDESTLFKKQRRLLSWEKNPGLLAKELEFWSKEAEKSKQVLKKFEQEKEVWLDSMHVARRLLTSSLKSTLHFNKKLKMDCCQLYRMCEAECGITTRKRRNMTMGDVVDELGERSSALEAKVEDFEEILAELVKAGKLSEVPVPTSELSPHLPVPSDNDSDAETPLVSPTMYSPAALGGVPIPAMLRMTVQPMFCPEDAPFFHGGAAGAHRSSNSHSNTRARTGTWSSSAGARAHQQRHLQQQYPDKYSSATRNGCGASTFTAYGEAKKSLSEYSGEALSTTKSGRTAGPGNTDGGCTALLTDGCLVRSLGTATKPPVPLLPLEELLRPAYARRPPPLYIDPLLVDATDMPGMPDMVLSAAPPASYIAEIPLPEYDASNPSAASVAPPVPSVAPLSSSSSSSDSDIKQENEAGAKLHSRNHEEGGIDPVKMEETEVEAGSNRRRQRRAHFPTASSAASFNSTRTRTRSNSKTALSDDDEDEDNNLDYDHYDGNQQQQQHHPHPCMDAADVDVEAEEALTTSESEHTTAKSGKSTMGAQLGVQRQRQRDNTAASPVRSTRTRLHKDAQWSPTKAAATTTTTTSAAATMVAAVCEEPRPPDLQVVFGHLLEAVRLDEAAVGDAGFAFQPARHDQQVKLIASVLESTRGESQLSGKSVPESSSSSGSRSSSSVGRTRNSATVSTQKQQQQWQRQRETGMEIIEQFSESLPKVLPPCPFLSSTRPFLGSNPTVSANSKVAMSYCSSGTKSAVADSTSSSSCRSSSCADTAAAGKDAAQEVPAMKHPSGSNIQDSTRNPSDKVLSTTAGVAVAGVTEASGDTAMILSTTVGGAKPTQVDTDVLKQAAPYLCLSRQADAEWASFLDGTFDPLNAQAQQAAMASSSNTRTRTKRQQQQQQRAKSSSSSSSSAAAGGAAEAGGDQRPFSVELRPHVERGVSLLLSPLSQYEDRVLGTLDRATVYKTVAHRHTQPAGIITCAFPAGSGGAAGGRGGDGSWGDGIGTGCKSMGGDSGKSASVSLSSSSSPKSIVCSSGFSYHVSVPDSLVAAEEVALARCHMQSLAAAAEHRKHVLKAVNTDLVKHVRDAHSSLEKVRHLHEQVVWEEVYEQRRIRKELVLHGIAEQNDNDPPFSPLGNPIHQLPPTLKAPNLFKAGSKAPKSKNTWRMPPKRGGVGLGGVSASIAFDPPFPAILNGSATSSPMSTVGADNGIAAGNGSGNGTKVISSSQTTSRSGRNISYSPSTAKAGEGGTTTTGRSGNGSRANGSTYSKDSVDSDVRNGQDKEFSPPNGAVLDSQAFGSKRRQQQATQSTPAAPAAAVSKTRRR